MIYKYVYGSSRYLTPNEVRHVLWVQGAMIVAARSSSFWTHCSSAVQAKAMASQRSSAEATVNCSLALSKQPSKSSWSASMERSSPAPRHSFKASSKRGRSSFASLPSALSRGSRPCSTTLTDVNGSKGSTLAAEPMALSAGRPAAESFQAPLFIFFHPFSSFWACFQVPSATSWSKH